MPGDRTEQATPHRRDKARKDGDILHSRELTAADRHCQHRQQVHDPEPGSGRGRLQRCNHPGGHADRDHDFQRRHRGRTHHVLRATRFVPWRVTEQLKPS